MNPLVISWGLVLVAANTFAIAMLPRTDGFTKLAPTLLSIGGFVVTAWALSRLIYSGVQLSILMPVAAAVIPLAAIAVGVVIYGESASILKMVLLASACGIIGIAARL